MITNSGAGCPKPATWRNRSCAAAVSNSRGSRSSAAALAGVDAARRASTSAVSQRCGSLSMRLWTMVRAASTTVSSACTVTGGSVIS
ncbi:hypothetical protein [Streptomyces atratus]|uniref:hypothetical protein n=1 Tax=Streptomyces atratus TaxID=1893 RepID=UPI0036503E04